ncbi:MAG: diguanylate cyclase, partial [Bryobacteraceae bacterium]
MSPHSRRFQELHLAVELRDALTEAPAGGVLPLVTALAARLLETPAAAIGVLDGNHDWVYFLHGLPDSWAGRGSPFFEATFDSQEPLVAADVRADARFAAQSPAIGGQLVRAFAGVPLQTAGGEVIGVLGVFDVRPRDFLPAQTAALSGLASLVMREMETQPNASAELSCEQNADAKMEQYRDLFDNAIDIVYTHDIAGRFTAVSRAIEIVTGYSREEVLRMSLADMAVPEQRRAIRQHILEQIGGAPSDNFEFAVLAKDGRRVTLEVNSRLLFKSGRPIGVQGFARDITKRAAEVARFGERLRQLHRLSVAEYASLDELFANYLSTGRAIFGVPAGLIVEGTDAEAVIRAADSSDGSFSSGEPAALTHFSGISAPILTGGSTYGTLYFGSAAAGIVRVPTAPDTELVDLMASSIGHFLAQFRIEEERDRHAALSEDVNGVLEMMAGAAPLTDTLAHLAQTIAHHAPGTAVAILLFRGGALTLEASADLPGAVAISLQQVEIEPGAAGRVDDLFQNSVWLPHLRGLAELGFPAGRAMPILSAGGKTLGVIAAFYRCAPPAGVLDKAVHLAAIAIEQRDLTDRLAYQAKHDLLTGLPNRLYLMEWLGRALPETRERNQQTAVIVIDLDRFKQINDSLGHATADLLLRQAGERLASLTPAGGAVAKMGGDEFAAVLGGIAGPAESMRFAERILDALRAPYHVNEH